MRTHGKPATYTNGCRCDECRIAWREYSRTNHGQQVQRKAAWQATLWVKRNRPDVWERLVQEADELVRTS